MINYRFKRFRFIKLIDFIKAGPGFQKSLYEYMTMYRKRPKYLVHLIIDDKQLYCFGKNLRDIDDYLDYYGYQEWTKNFNFCVINLWTGEDISLKYSNFFD